MAEWNEPKTDWTSQDAFDYIQFNRVMGNVAFLKAFSDTLFGYMENLPSVEEKSNLSLIYAREMNVIEDGLDKINANTYKFDIGDKKTYKPNGRVPDYQEYNRIESACKRLYDAMMVLQDNLVRLDFRFGNQKGIRV